MSCMGHGCSPTTTGGGGPSPAALLCSPGEVGAGAAPLGAAPLGAARGAALLSLCPCRVVLSVNDKWHYCQNSDILVGSRAMRDRHLRLLGYCLVQVSACTAPGPLLGQNPLLLVARAGGGSWCHCQGAALTLLLEAGRLWEVAVSPQPSPRCLRALQAFCDVFRRCLATGFLPRAPCAHPACPPQAVAAAGSDTPAVPRGSVVPLPVLVVAELSLLLWAAFTKRRSPGSSISS